MEYSDYGLSEGLVMLIPTLIVVLLVYVYKIIMYKKIRKYLTLLFSMVLLGILLDTLMWVFSIQTNIIDYLVKFNGGIEQVTIFMIMSMVSFAFLVNKSEDKNGDNKIEE